MSEQEASETFRTLLGLDVSAQAHRDSEVLGQPLVHFDNLPLAIAQAAAYVRETDMTLLEYFNLFRECERNQQHRLSEGVLTIGDNTDSGGSVRASRAVMTTWKITRRDRPRVHTTVGDPQLPRP
jgi:hypothetical protein